MSAKSFEVKRITVANIQRCLERLLENVTSASELISQPANILINIFQQAYGGDLLVPLLIKILAKETKIYTKLNDCNKLISTLEVFMVLLKETTNFVTKPRNVKQCVFLISKVAFEYYRTPAVTQPIIGSMLTLRDLNLKATMTNLSKLNP